MRLRASTSGEQFPDGSILLLGCCRGRVSQGRATGAIASASLPAERNLIDRYAAALSNAGPIAQSLSGMMSVAGLWAAATTPLAVDFLTFVADSESDAAA